MIFFTGYLLLLLGFFVYSYGFVDVNLHLTNASWFTALQAPLSNIVYRQMNVAGAIYVFLIAGLYLFYLAVIRTSIKNLTQCIPVKMTVFFAITAGILLFSFPAFTYDIFNYMTTARVTFVHKENPYIVMPVEIPNEPGLAYTRAANKVALYGPMWLLLTWVPHTLGRGNVWLTIITFKLFIVMFYIAMLYLIWKITKNIKQVLFFGLNPLVLVEVLVSGHNDIVMMVPVVYALGMARKRVFAWLVSVGVKGATIVLLPLVLFPVGDRQKLYKIAYWLMVAVFVIAAPLREELYPWYAVWFLSFAALIPMKKRSFTPHHRDAGFIHGFSIALCMGLSLRHLPYILTRVYEGPGPMLRMILTILPVGAYVLHWWMKHRYETA